MRARARVGIAVLAAAVLAPGAASADELIGTLKRIKETRTILVGYRESSIPFSYLSRRGEPMGYSIDLCNEVIDEVSIELDGMEVAVNYRPVTSQSRIPALVAGEIDIECGSTTSNFERKKQVAFSPTFFVSGTKLLVRRNARLASYRDLRGKTVAVTAGTTNEAAVKALSDKQKLDIKFVTRKGPRRSPSLRGGGKGRCVRDRRRPALRPHRDDQIGQRVHGGRRVPVLRPVWPDVPQGRSAIRGGRRAPLHQAGREPRTGAALQQVVPASGCPQANASTCR